MSSTGSTIHNKRLASETDNSQRVLDNDSAQNLKRKERQHFFEDVYQHDVDNNLPSAHLQVSFRKPPMGSISSMEVNVDVLEQMDLMDISDQEALDVFLNSGADEGALASPLPVSLSSTSSGSSDTSGGGADTPVIQSDDEEVHADTLLLTSVPHTRDEETEEEDEEEKCLATKSP
ncbi:Dysbindin [Dissostichus eleginoides]|uniref:Dysbindin n=1 Tax=Dissostichus eleginoides TaxID=100907 RepID=A0AAD9CBD9_DISEL|nr:Dysbindin [Dissostichus eleginoides]